MKRFTRDTLKSMKFLGIGMVLLLVVGLITWQSVDRYKEVQQIESKLGFDITVVNRQSHEAWWAATRTYLVKPLADGKESSMEYLFYLNKENKIEQWAQVKNGKTMKPIITETE
ncbi:hypothetical protein [Peribacillus deserti]|uniref:DUF3139 domain-containing protein n=1 Tax=Peribacillus deserti TaxID=673318 RepID=A0A2N5M2X7_9BACI|nr:hypothetical protein [Peribacillus deserti]PLT28675.1 hypothetical protein CUU66_17430 [Peribacillus deserti]